MQPDLWAEDLEQTLGRDATVDLDLGGGDLAHGYVR
jgi:hypothetical protein